eukprot:1431983-Pyramimonas_sp.AAC.1
MTQTWNRKIIPQSLEAHGLFIAVEHEGLSWNRHEYIQARVKRQGGASANVTKKRQQQQSAGAKMGLPT